MITLIIRNLKSVEAIARGGGGYQLCTVEDLTSQAAVGDTSLILLSYSTTHVLTKLLQNFVMQGWRLHSDSSSLRLKETRAQSYSRLIIIIITRLNM